MTLLVDALSDDMDRAELPSGWRWEQLGEVCDIVRGVSWDKGEVIVSPKPGYLPILRAGNIGESLDTKSDLVWVPAANISVKQILRKGDIAICLSSGSPAVVGKTARLIGSFEGAVGAFCGVIRARDQSLADYLSFWFRSKGYLNWRDSQARGSNIQNLRVSELGRIPVPLPPPDEQRRIVAGLEATLAKVNAARAALTRTQTLLKRYRAAVLNAAVSGRLTADWRAAHPEAEPAPALLSRILAERRQRWEKAEAARYAKAGKTPPFGWRERYKEPAAPDTSELEDLPEGWCWATVEQTASPEPRSIQSGPFGSALLHSEFQESGILAIGIDNVLDGVFTLGSQHRISREKFDKLRKFQARPFDVLVTVMATVGRCCVVPGDVESAIITKHVYRISCNPQALNPRFLMLAIRGGIEVRNQLFGEIRGQTRPGVNGEILKQLAIPLPPLTEQDEIVAKVAGLLSFADIVEARTRQTEAKVEQTAQAVLAAAFRGELVARYAADEPVEKVQVHRA